MKRAALARWARRAAIGTRQRGGWPLLVALAALLGVLVLALALIPAWQADAERLATQALAWQREARDLGLRARADAETAAAPMPAWPAAEAAAARMADLLALALRHGIAVERVQQGESAARISMPVRGAYPDLRRFVAEALHADPALALDRLSLRRADPQTPELEGELHWVMLQGANEAPR
jgi:hypothetical protein